MTLSQFFLEIILGTFIVLALLIPLTIVVTVDVILKRVNIYFN